MVAVETRLRSLEAISEYGRGRSDTRRYMQPRSRSRSRPRSRDHAANGPCWYHWKFGSEARRLAPLNNQRERNGPSLMAASDAGHPTRRFFTTDCNTGISFLIDTGADLCVYPRKMVRGQRQKSSYELSAANGTIIHTYGTETMTLNLGLRRALTWRFVVADVSRPIIGADFLAFYGLLVDLRNNRLVDQITNLITPARCVRCDTPCMKTITGATRYHQLLAQFPNVTKPGRRPDR